MQNQSEIRTEITHRIAEALKSGQAPWRKPWTNDPNSGFPTNLISKKKYRGINPLLLEIAAMGNHFVSRWWATYKQWQEAGGQVRRGSKGTRIVFYRTVERPEVDPETGEKADRIKRFFLLRTYVVFNLDQVDGDKLDRFRPIKGDQKVDIASVDWARADNAIAATNADIHYGGNQAYYARPIGGTWPHHLGGDYIVVPCRQQYEDVRDFYESQFHELIHWTQCRLGWYGPYSVGELIAEIGAAFISCHLCLPQSENLENHQAYLACWLTGMQYDPEFIFRAASQASKAADYVLSFSRPLEAAPEAAEAVEAHVE